MVVPYICPWEVLMKKELKKPIKKKKTTKGLLRDKQFIPLYLELGTAKDAYKAMHPKVTDRSAGELGHKMLKNIDFGDLLEAAGVTDKKLVERINEGLDSSYKKGIKTGETDKGKPIYEVVDQPDMDARHKYTETALRLKKRLIDRVALGTGEQGEEPIAFVVRKAPITEKKEGK